MRSKISALAVKKKLIGIAVVIVALLVFLNIVDKKEITVSEDSVYLDTISISRSYVALRLKTDKILKEAASYTDYKTWNGEMTELINSWEDLDSKVSELDEQAESIFEEKVSFNIINVANAYTKDEISNVFDKAPAGRKIRTLAKYLGVDAKRAFKILKTDQDFVKADAWNEAGDTFKKLEVSAVVIKDGCKVAGFVGAMAMTGGAVGTAAVGSAGVGTGIAAGSATLAEGTIMVVTGTDLMLEISEDAATIALGDNHKAVKTISNIRSVTDPAASLLSLTDIPKNVAKGAALLDKVGVVLVQVDQVRSMVQDGKLLGIKISPDSKTEVAAIKESEAEEWIEEYEKELADIIDDDSESLEDWLDDYEDVGDWLEELEIEDEIDDEELEEEGRIGAEETEITEKTEINTEDEDLVRGYTKDGKVSVTMINAVEPLISHATNRWKVKVDGYEKTLNMRGYNCYWDYYTEYDYGVEPWMNLMGCDRTSGVPGKFRPVGDPPGELRVVVRVEFVEYGYTTDEQGHRSLGEDIITDTVTLEKNYVITPWGGDSY